MPQININENEVVSSSALDITDNVVFVPVFTKNEELDGKFKLYSNLSDFSESTPVQYKYFDENNNSVVKSNERSYVYARECLEYGLKVLVYYKYLENDISAVYTETPMTQTVTTSGTSDQGWVGSITLSGTEEHHIKDTSIIVLDGFYNNGAKVTQFTRTTTGETTTTENVDIVLVYNKSTKVVTISGWNSQTDSITADSFKYTIKDQEKTPEEAGSSLMALLLGTEGTDEHDAKVTKYSPLDSLGDKNLYNVKFITSGGYQSIPYMVTTAENRGDCLALWDLDENTKVSSLLAASSDQKIMQVNKFAACFFPWCIFSFLSTVTGITGSGTTSDYKLPGSLAYLLAYGRSVQSNANWFAASGVTRGTVPSLVAPVEDITEAQMHQLQGDEGTLSFYVNPIMMVGSYGYKVWGNRTTYVNYSVDSYFKYLNIRMLLCDIKKTLYEASIRSTFEPNDDVTWINFKAMCSGLLDRMTSGRGLNWYRWRRVPTKKKATIEAILTISPIEAVENFDLTVMLTDQDVTVTETL